MYVGVPPLYKLDMGRGKSQYCYTEEERKAATAKLAPGSYHVQRFKVGHAGVGRGWGSLSGWGFEQWAWKLVE